MNIDLTQDQRELADGARSFLAAFGSAAASRAAYEHGYVPEPSRWERLAGIGFLSLIVPEEFGGMGLGDLELALVLEQAGYTALPESLLETAVAALTLAESCDDALRARWLPALADGSARAAIRTPGSTLVVDADLADIFVLGDDAGIDLMTRDHLTWQRQPAFDRARRVFTVEAPAVGTAETLGDAVASERLAQRAAVASAALLVGNAQYLLDLTVAYVKERRQFDRPIGSFQAVKHRLADVHQLISNARPTVWVAAQVVTDSDPDAPMIARVAKASASAAAAAANHAALQFHGGIGFAWEHDLQMWLKRGKALELAYGSPDWCHRGIAERLFTG